MDETGLVATNDDPMDKEAYLEAHRMQFKWPEWETKTAKCLPTVSKDILGI